MTVIFIISWILLIAGFGCVVNGAFLDSAGALGLMVLGAFLMLAAMVIFLALLIYWI